MDNKLVQEAEAQKIMANRCRSPSRLASSWPRVGFMNRLWLKFRKVHPSVIRGFVFTLVDDVENIVGHYVSVANVEAVFR